MDRPAQNRFIADRLRETATLLEQQGANRFRVAAYRRAADTVESLAEDVTSIIESKGFDGLMELPAIYCYRQYDRGNPDHWTIVTTANIARKPKRESFAVSLRIGSIRTKNRGCRFCTQSEVHGCSRCFTLHR